MCLFFLNCIVGYYLITQFIILKAFPPLLSISTKALFLGTFPSVVSLNKQCYYGNSQNKFWKLVYDVFKEPFENEYQKRISFLHSKDFGLWDVIANCEREGSLDTAIRNIKINDFETLLREYPHIKTFYFTSKKAYTWCDYRLYKDSLNVELVLLASPSPANTLLSYDAKLADWIEKIKV